MSFRSIRSRIAGTYLILIALAMAGVTWYVIGFVRESYVTQLQARMTADARLLAETARPSLVTGGSERADALADQYAAILGDRVTFIDSKGTVIGDSEASVDTMLNHLQRPEIVDARAHGLGVALRYGDTLQYDSLYVAVPLYTGATEQGYVRLAVPLRAIDATVGTLRRRILGATGLILAVVVAIGIALAEKTARPLRELTAVARRVAGGDMSARLVARSQDEVGLLTNAFFSMTDRLRANIDDLSRERTEASAILEHMADGIVITDDAGRIQLINRAAQRILGATGAEAVGRSLPQIARDEEIILAMRACLRERQEQNELVELSRNNLPLQVIATPLSAATGDIRCLLVFQDLGQVRRLETYRRDFVSNLSHELRTPIASLRALVDTLRGGALEDPPAAKHFLERMDTEIDDLTQMVEELLELSRIESGQAPIRLAPVALQAVVERAVDRLRPQAERAEIVLETTLPADLPLILVDSEQLHLVITNLVQNAIKFTPPGGRVVVSAESAPEQVTVRVKDTGIGIPASALPRIFERFYKGDPARASRGTGLGLAIAKHIVQAHGGQISAASVEGQGSTFSFTLLTANGSTPSSLES
jgi:two-component system phosphate regulon sensor histidine kinase PhoR